MWASLAGAFLALTTVAILMWLVFRRYGIKMIDVLDAGSDYQNAASDAGAVRSGAGGIVGIAGGYIQMTGLIHRVFSLDLPGRMYDLSKWLSLAGVSIT